MHVAGTTVVCGLERLGLRVVRALIQLGETVVVVAEAPDPALLREALNAGARFVEGRGRDVAQLAGVPVESARCLVLTENADLGNLHAALAARELNPGLRIVMRMFNAELAGRAGRLLPNSRVVSASLEAAPYFAAGALGLTTVSTRHVWGRHLVVRAAGGGAGPIHRLDHSLHPVQGGEVQDDGAVASDGHTMELGEGHLLAPIVIEAPPLPRRRRFARLARFRRAVMAFLDLRLGVTLGAIGLLVTVSVVVFHSALRLSWVDALYFTVTTAATTSYGDISLVNSAWWVKLYGVLFIFAAALSMATLFALAADAVIGARILEALGVPHGRMRNHVIVVGLGNTGYRVVQHLLAAGIEVAAAEVSDRNRFVATARRQGVPVLIGDGRYRDSLRALSVERARALVTASDDDLANLEAALTARELNPEARVVARLFDPDLADLAQHQLGINACYSVSALATPVFVAAALGDGVLSTIEHGSQLWLVAELRIEPDSPLVGTETAALESAGNLDVLAVRDSEAERWRPGWPERLEAGYEVLVACDRSGWERIRARARAAVPVG